MKTFEKFLRLIALKLYRGFIVEKNITPSAEDLSKVKTILVVLRHMMGDMLCAVPMIMSLKQSFPSSKIILVTKASTRFEEFFTSAGNSPVDDVYYYEKGFEKYINLIKTLQLQNIELAVVPSTVVFSGTNHLIAHHSKARIVVGVKSLDYEPNPAWYLLNVKNDFDWGVKKVHQVERNLDIIRQLKINPSVTKIELKPDEKSAAHADEFFRLNYLGKSKKIIGFHPGAGKKTNVWEPAKFAELASRLSTEFSADIFISEGPADRDYVIEMNKILREKFGIKDTVVHKGTLANNAAIIARLNLFVTNDTGIMHIASGLGTPLVALFGETKAYEWGLLGENKYSIQSPNGQINGIGVDDVYKVCKGILDGD